MDAGYGAGNASAGESVRRIEAVRGTDPKVVRSHGLAWVALRYFNAAGADAEGEIGEDHQPETHLVPSVIQATLGAPVQILGTDYPTPDGTAVRDYIHVEDLVEAHVKALDHLDRGGEGMAVNLGTGTGHSVREVIAAVERVSGCPVPFRTAGRRAGDHPERRFDCYPREPRS